MAANTDESFTIHVFVLFEPIFRTSLTLEASTSDVTVEILAMGALMLTKVVSGNIGGMAKALNVYNLLTHQFLDCSKTLAENGITGSTVLVLTNLHDAHKINDIVTVRQATALELAEMEILNGG